jgi:hypothetical protein
MRSLFITLALCVLRCEGWFINPGIKCLSNSPQHSLLSRFSGEKDLPFYSKRSLPSNSVLSVKAGLFDSVFGSSKPSPAQRSTETSQSQRLGTWEEVTDPTSGSTYFWNKETGETAWDRPTGLEQTVTAVSTPSKLAPPIGVTPSGQPYGMPNLYNGWFSGSYTYMGADGETERAIVGTNEVADQFISAVNRALADGLTRLEVSGTHTPLKPFTRTRTRTRHAHRAHAHAQHTHTHA